MSNTTTINDGFNDPTTNTSTNDFGTGGNHLSTPSSFTFTHAITVTFTFGAEPKGYMGGGFSYEVYPDSRTLGIAGSTSTKTPIIGLSGLDAYNNPLYQPGPEPPGYSDIGLGSWFTSSPPSAITVPWMYGGVLNGDWSPNGTYSWSETLYGDSPSGAVSPSSPTIQPLTVTYQGGTGMTDPLGDAGHTDVVKLKYTDAADGATTSSSMVTLLHPNYVASALSGQPPSSDGNYYAYTMQALSWPNGMSPANITENYPVSSTAAYATHGILLPASVAAQSIGALATAYSSYDLVDGKWGAIASAAGIILQDVVNGLPQSGSISEASLWPTGGPGPYPSQWAVANQTSPIPFPSNAGAPHDWSPGSTGPLSVKENVSCAPFAINRYVNTLYGVDAWGDGYAGYQELLSSTFNCQFTIGLWTYTSR
jgi:hypothetical protein